MDIFKDDNDSPKSIAKEEELHKANEAFLHRLNNPTPEEQQGIWAAAAIYMDWRMGRNGNVRSSGKTNM